MGRVLCLHKVVDSSRECGKGQLGTVKTFGGDKTKVVLQKKDDILKYIDFSVS